MDKVSAVAPDASSMSAAKALSAPGKWQERGAAEGPSATLWGLCKGSGSKPYQASVDLDVPAYRCSCPSRKFPCKHALGLLLMWSAGNLDDTSVAPMPDWVREWHESRAGRAAKVEAKRAAIASGGPPTDAQLKAAAKRVGQRDERIAGGVAELAQWLDDQIRNGVAGLDRVGYQHFDRLAARLVDAQAPGLAREVRGLAQIASSGEGWDERMVAALGMLRLLTRAHERLAELPVPLAESVRSHIGLTTPVEQVMTTPRVRDVWQVIGVRDEVEERLTTRRAWLLGRETSRYALVLAFAVAGQPLTADLVVGTEIDADLCFYPAAAPLRAVVAHRHAPAVRCVAPEPTVKIENLLDGYANAVAADPWLGPWPVALRGVVSAGRAWHVVDDSGHALPVRTGGRDLWHFVGAAGGEPATIAGEWSPDGLRLLALYIDGEVIAA